MGDGVCLMDGDDVPNLFSTDKGTGLQLVQNNERIWNEKHVLGDTYISCFVFDKFAYLCLHISTYQEGIQVKPFYRMRIQCICWVHHQLRRFSQTIHSHRTISYRLHQHWVGQLNHPLWKTIQQILHRYN